MKFNIRLGIPEMLELWTDLQTKKKLGTLSKDEDALYRKLGQAMAHLSQNPQYPGLQKRCFELKALDKYADNMNKSRYLYCTTILELMKRGYGYRESRNMLAYSKLLDKEYGWMLFHNMGVKDWADIAEDGEHARNEKSQPPSISGQVVSA